ncbi:MAG: amidohydrolase family protein [Edaphobacter sp.]|uniref:N-acyl-D-amino-acid deacylase family protein n=1 Tax=Edaphobacter sp. TaxID=1934404 RepID=UPI00239D8445|nr:amidohydrolase family protein [Edaphobacter sp.]MDE1175833.1 amidohydrolase family protein [Edaphobacter sp.]
MIGKLALTVMFALPPLAAVSQQPAYDVVIRNGRVLDGSGSPWIAADVAIAHGRFVKIGRVEGKGRREIDAKGLYVSPGWIDAMDQSGATLLKNGLADNKVREGVTTAIAGESGAPVPAEQLASYFAQLNRQGISINFGTYYSEEQARIAVLDHSTRVPSAEELGRMKTLMATAMKGGARGMTTALIYPPGSFAQTPELIAMASVAGQYGGIYASHVRDEGAGVLSGVDELIEISEKAHLPGEIFHVKVAYKPDWGRSMQLIGEHVNAARARGVEVAADMYLYDAGGTWLQATIPSWAFEGGEEKLKERLKDPTIRARLKREQQVGSPGWWNILTAAGGWDGIMLSDATQPQNRKYLGKSMVEIAKDRNSDPADAAFDLVAEEGAGLQAVYHMMSEQDVQTALRFPWTSIGSDAGSSEVAGGASDLNHPRAYGNFPRLIARYVREQHVLTLEEAVRKMTGWPAERFRLEGRGLIREGMWADVTMFNYDTIQDTSTYEKPVSYPKGIEYVLVNGEVVVEHEQHTGAKPGEVLYGPGYEAKNGGTR